MNKQVSTQIEEFKSINDQLSELSERYDGVVYDMDNKKDNKQARSDSYSIARSCGVLNKAAQELKAPHKERIDLIQSEFKRIESGLRGIQSGIKGQIDAHEAKEKERESALDQMVADIDALWQFGEFDTPTSTHVAERLEKLNAVVIDDRFKSSVRELAAMKSKEAGIAKLTEMHAELLASEKAEAECIEKERAEAEAKRQTELKAAAEQARIEAEQKAQREAEERERQEREAEANRQAEHEAELKRAEQLRIDAEKDAIQKAERQQAEHDAKLRQAEQDRLNAEAESKRQQEYAEQRAKEAKKLAEYQAREAAERAEREKQEALRQAELGRIAEQNRLQAEADEQARLERAAPIKAQLLTWASRELSAAIQALPEGNEETSATIEAINKKLMTILEGINKNYGNNQ